jgi:predicted enzyme related to lactoylglutathione lyase
MNLLMKCNDIAETKSFYSGILQFDVSDTAKDTCSVQKAGGTIIFSSGDNLGSSPSMTGTIYFFVPHVDEYFETIKDNVDVQWPLQDMPYGTREFGIRDCNGYHLAIVQDREV